MVCKLPPLPGTTPRFNIEGMNCSCMNPRTVIRFSMIAFVRHFCLIVSSNLLTVDSWTTGWWIGSWKKCRTLPAIQGIPAVLKHNMVQGYSPFGLIFILRAWYYTFNTSVGFKYITRSQETVILPNLNPFNNIIDVFKISHINRASASGYRYSGSFAVCAAPYALVTPIMPTTSWFPWLQYIYENERKYISIMLSCYGGYVEICRE